VNITGFLVELTKITGDKSPSITWTNINGTLELHTRVMINNEEVHDLSQRTGGDEAWNYEGTEEMFFSLVLGVMRRRVDEFERIGS
jgi:hypothetical protein